MSVNSKMTAIADAIRNLLDISGTMGLDAMASNISSITKRGAVAGTITTKSEQYIIPAGYHNGNGSVGISSAEQEKLIAENIKNGVTILGVSGTASGDIYAIIAVTYPEGSVCSCTNGTKTLKAKDTSGKALFNVPNIGTWTVTARTEDGSSTANKTVDITEAGQVETVSISYELWLFKDGNQYTDATGGWEDGINYVYETSAQTPVNYNTSIHLNSNVSTDAIAKTVNKIDLTDIASIKFTLTASDSSNNNKKLLAIMSNDSGRIVTENIASIDCGSASVGSVISLDVSGITGKYYVLFATTNERTFSVNNVRCYREGES